VLTAFRLPIFSHIQQNDVTEKPEMQFMYLKSWSALEDDFRTLRLEPDNSAPIFNALRSESWFGSYDMGIGAIFSQ
jgi:hypothetical protein